MSNRFHHIAVTVSDLAAAEVFWDKVFLAERITRPTSGVHPEGIWLRIGGLELHLQYRERRMQKTDQHFALIVEAADDYVTRAKAQGRQVETREPFTGFRKRYYLYDPDGNRVELLEP